jgi:serine protease Do
MDHQLDVALLKMSAADNLPRVVLADDERPDTGEEVTVIGNPGLGTEILNRTMTTGIVSNPDRVFEGLHYVQTSAAVNPGNSGGPMFDSRGHVIGLVTLKGAIEGAAFAVPAKELREFLQQAIDGK